MFLAFPAFMFAQELSNEELTELMNNSVLQYEAGSFQEALAGFLEVGRNTAKQRTEEERQNYVSSQIKTVKCYEQLRQFETGFQICEMLLVGDLNDKEKGILQELYVSNGYHVAISYIIDPNRRYTDARAVLEKILPLADADMRQQVLGLVPITWYFEGVQFQMKQQYNQALACEEKACQGFHENGNWKDETDAWCQIGDIKQNLYDAIGALEAYKQAAILAEANQSDSKLMSILIGQWKLSEQLGDSEYAQELKSRMDMLADSSKDNVVLFKYYNHLGDEAVNQGNYRMAEHWYHKNDSYINQLDDDYSGGEPHQYYLKLRSLCMEKGEWDEAMKYALLEKKELQSRFSKEDWAYYVSYGHIANIYKLKGDTVNCFRSLDTLFASLDKIDEPKEVEKFYGVRARCYAAFKDYGKALEDYKMADKLLAIKYGEDDNDRVKLLASMGGMEHKLGHYEESEYLFRKYADRIKMLQGESHAEYIDALGYLANAEAFAGHFESACGDYSNAVDKMKNQLREKVFYFTTAEREGYWESVSELFQRMTPFALKAEEYQTAFTRSCYDGLVLTKAFLLASERTTYNLIKSEGTMDDLKDFATISAMQAKIREWGKNENEHVDSILYLTSKINRMETQLSRRCREYGDVTSFMNVDYQTVKNKLGEGDVLIDFTDFLSVSDNQKRIYAAYIINNEQEYPMVKRLFDESSVDSILMAHPDLFYDTSFSDHVYHLLWESFENEVNEGAIVYYVPSQLLFQVALESLRLEDGSLLGDHYRFIRLSSARELASFDNKLNLKIDDGKTNAVLYGGLQYDVEASVMAAEAKRYDISQLLSRRGSGLRGDSIFRELPWSKIEIDTIEKKLKDRGFPAHLYDGAKGTEESFLSLNGNAPQILHVATHGFYYTPDKAKEVEYLRGYEDAMSLTGLVMSGGNAAWRGHELPEGVLDGILTANDIAQLDLSDVDLVVLSACQSGNGKATSEGLYGLQRAFKKAGVKTMVMSLWDVIDPVGTEYMITFYESLLDESKGDVRMALNTAKSKIREKYPEPYFWAGFVVLD